MPFSLLGKLSLSVRTRLLPINLHARTPARACMSTGSRTAARMLGSDQVRCPGPWGSDPKASPSSLLVEAPLRKLAGRPCGSSACWKRTCDGAWEGAGGCGWPGLFGLKCLCVVKSNHNSPNSCALLRTSDDGYQDSAVRAGCLPLPFHLWAGIFFCKQGSAPELLFSKNSDNNLEEL